MLTRRQFLSLAGSAALASGAVLLTGCASGPVDLEADPKVRLGEERCAFCTMSIDDARFAAAWRTPSGAEKHFDDIGCMVDAYRKDGPAEGTRFWVHDYRGAAWLKADSATYVVSSTIRTPMAYGVAAFASAADATAAVPTARATIAWADVLSTVERKG